MNKNNKENEKINQKAIVSMEQWNINSIVDFEWTDKLLSISFGQVEKNGKKLNNDNNTKYQFINFGFIFLIRSFFDLKMGMRFKKVDFAVRIRIVELLSFSQFDVYLWRHMAAVRWALERVSVVDEEAKLGIAIC